MAALPLTYILDRRMIVDVLVCAPRGYVFGEDVFVGYDRLAPRSITGSAPRPTHDSRLWVFSLHIRQVSYITCWVKRRARGELPETIWLTIIPSVLTWCQKRITESTRTKAFFLISVLGACLSCCARLFRWKPDKLKSLVWLNGPAVSIIAQINGVSVSVSTCILWSKLLYCHLMFSRGDLEVLENCFEILIRT